MTKTKIPKTIEEAQKTLEGIGQLLTAREWERAAVVFAYTRDGGQGEYQQEQKSSAGLLTTGEFAALNITGLRSKTTVLEYRKAWQWAIDNGMATEVKPGDAIELPTVGWPPVNRPRGTTREDVVRGFRNLVEEDPKQAVKDLIQDSPTTVPKLAKGVRTAHAGLAAMAATPDAEEEAERVSSPREEYVPDYSKDLRYAANAIQRVLIGIQNGKWEPDSTERTLIAFLAMAFNDITKGEPVRSSSTGTVIKEIEDFLQKETQR